MFVVNEKLVCIDNQHSESLIVGKVYTVKSFYSSVGDIVFVTLEESNHRQFYQKRFISLKEYRKRKIESLCLQ